MNKHEHRRPYGGMNTNPYYDKESTEKDPDDRERDTWSPTPAQFQAFLTRDHELALSNVRLAMSSRGLPMTVRDLKESTLHSIDCIERVLKEQIAAGQVKENKGRYERVTGPR